MSARKRPKRDYLTPAERKIYGVTATLVNTETGELKTEVFRGNISVGAATKECAAFCDQLGPAWKVRTLSTPISIVSDLLNCGQQRSKAFFTEHSLLSHIGRPDLIEMRAKYAGLRTREMRARWRKQ